MATTTETTPRRGYSDDKDQLLKRLRRIEGQTRGLQGMVADDRWCPDILQQIAAVRAALDKVALGLAEGHVQHCMVQGADDPERREQMTAELMHAMGRLVG
jgi:DNA-binding FrmR family transcriptional regulator